MKTILALAILTLASCTLPDTEGANPLDRPYDSLSAEQLHEKNLKLITSNPAYRLAE